MDVKKLSELLENFDNGDEKEYNELLSFLKSEGITIEEAEEMIKASAEQVPETAVEARKKKAGKAVDDVKATRDALPLDKIADAFGVNLKTAVEEGDLETGELGEYLNKRGVNQRVEGESMSNYKDRMLNAFDHLGLNFYSPEDRKLVRQSLAHYGQMDYRQGLADEVDEGILGTIGNIFAPRLVEHAKKDILNGERTDGYLKDWLVDTAENVAMTSANPATGIAGKVGKVAKVADKLNKSNKAVKATGVLGGYLADAAAVPFATEGLDAIVYDDDDNARSEFQLNDAVLGSLINMIAPVRIYRTAKKGGQVAKAGGNELTEAVETISNTAPIKKAITVAEPFVLNKGGKSEMVRNEAESFIKKQKNREQRIAKKSESRRDKYDKWSRGLAIPMPGDKDFEEFEKWKKAKLYSLADYVR